MMAMAKNKTPFDLGDIKTYQQWRDWKLTDYPRTADELMVEVSDLAAVTADERAALMSRIIKTNMAVYAATDGGDREQDTERQAVQTLAANFGLSRIDANLCADADGLTPLSVSLSGDRPRYIPYTNRSISWHTDGYYNAPEQTIRGMLLHCVRCSMSGGENTLMDPEIAYILVRDENPDYIEALSRPDVMTIPANVAAGGEGDGEGGDVGGEHEIRPARSGPVFSINPTDGSLHMRYTARTRSIEWRDDPLTTEAVAFLSEVIGGNDYIFMHRLQPGQGYLTNNVLHNRTSFDDPSPASLSDDADTGRLILRGRYLDRVAATGMNELSY